MTYSEKLLDPKWQKKRLEIFNRDKWQCVYCGDAERTLHVHHREYSGSNPWDISNNSLETCCCHCHSLIEFVKDSNSGWLIMEARKKLSKKGNPIYFLKVEAEGQEWFTLIWFLGKEPFVNPLIGVEEVGALTKFLKKFHSEA